MARRKSAIAMPCTAHIHVCFHFIGAGQKKRLLIFTAFIKYSFILIRLLKSEIEGHSDHSNVMKYFKAS